jgi:hypothetical protein
VVVVGACYTPDVEDCAYTCAMDMQCPKGSTCRGGACRVGSGAACMQPCAWSYQPVNADPCLYAVSMPEWSILESFTYDTDAPMQPGQPEPHDELSGIGEVRILRVGTLTIAAGVTVTLVGQRPLIVFVHDAGIAGDIIARNSTQLMSCSMAKGTPAEGDGGIGGAFIGNGGNGGYGAGVMTPVIAQAGEPTTLEPLRGGCPGTDGVGVTAGKPGIAGDGGGAIQISAETELFVPGNIYAPGGGGTGAQLASVEGGGGGGAGGGILLEAALLKLGPGTFCAEGGGGGEAGTAGNNGGDGCLGANAHKGGTGLSTGRDGGDGGADNMPNGMPGFNGPTGGDGGGGGGGGVGRIRLRFVVTQPDMPRFSPPPFIEDLL